MKRLLIALLALMLLVPPAHAEWIDLGSSKSDAPSAIRLVETTADRTVVELDLTGFHKNKATVEGAEYLTLDMPGASQIMEKGMPDLPKFTALVAVPFQTKPEIKVLAEEVVTFKMENPVLSSKGHLTRDVNPETVPFTFEAAYKADAFFPAAKVAADEQFTMRDLEGLRLVLTPVRYNPVSGVLEVTKKMTVQVSHVSRAAVQPIHETTADFEYVYGQRFINYTASPMRAKNIVKGKLLIVTLDAFAEAMAPYVNWKKKIGWDVEMVNLSKIGTTADELKAFIQSKYDAEKIGYYLLVGDFPEMPTLYGKMERAASDPCYMKLAGNDNIPDASIARISAKTVADVENQVAKFVHYEQFPATGAAAAWYKKGMGIASNEGNPTDIVRCNWLRDAMLGYTFNVVDQIYDPAAPKAKVTEGVNDGRSIINYIGHGSETTWVTSRFANGDIDKLENGRKFPVIWSVACVNGKFTMTTDCFAERWLKVGSKDDPKGAVICFAASTNAPWVPPCDMQSEIIKVQMIQGKSITAGGQALAGVLKNMEIWGTTDKSQGNQVNEQYILFGDNTLIIRTDVPKAVAVAHKYDEKQLTLTVTADGQPLEGATVTVNAGREENELFVSDAKGNVTLPVENRPEGGVTVTVYGQNLVPVVDQVLQ